MKSRPSGEKRRKEMARQERNREKEERRKARRQARQDGTAAPAEDADVVIAETPLPAPTAEGDVGAESAGR